MRQDLSDLHAGLSGCVLVPEHFDLGEGVVISQTYAHFMAPFLMAFAPASPGKPHPRPWKAASGGLVIDISAELHLPLHVRLDSLDRLNTICWIAALLRLRSTADLFVPVVSTERLSSIAQVDQDPELLPVEIHFSRLRLGNARQARLDIDELQWVRSHWVKGSDLLKNEDFSVAVQAIDSCIWNASPGLALVEIWGALERLFSRSRQELSFRVSANIATFLEQPGRERHVCFRRIRGLYDRRSRAAHGEGRRDGSAALLETYEVARLALCKMIEENHVPTGEQLESWLFGDGADTEPRSPLLH